MIFGFPLLLLFFEEYTGIITKSTPILKINVALKQALKTENFLILSRMMKKEKQIKSPNDEKGRKRKQKW